MLIKEMTIVFYEDSATLDCKIPFEKYTDVLTFVLAE